MRVIDVIFALNLQPLTYLCPDEFSEKAVPGMLVTAPLRNKTKTGIILGDSTYKSESVGKTLKSIISLEGESPILTPSHLKLIEWVSSYYFSNAGLVLASVLPDELFHKSTKKRKSKPTKHLYRALTIRDTELSEALKVVKQNSYTCVLIKMPDFLYELSYAVRLLSEVSSAIVLCPGKADSEILANMVSDTGATGNVTINSGLTSAQKRDTYHELIDGTASKVIGTMPAVLCPIKKPSLIIVLEEQSPHYKQLSSPRYNARDAAIMRAYMENIPVILMSKTPSATSYYNASTGKYKYLEIKSYAHPQAVSVVQTRQTLSDRVISTIKTALKKQHKILIFINRRGHSIVVCAECGLIDECPKCKSPLGLHNKKTMLCHRCKHEGKIKEICPRCKGVDLRQAGAGTQKIEEFLLKNTEAQPLRVDSDCAKTPKELEKLLAAATKATIVVGTRIILKRLFFRGHFDLIVVANPDVYFSFPDYMASERLYQDVSALSEMIPTAGRLIIQTSIADKDIYRFLRHSDYDGFIKSEINKRKQLHYPPYGRLAKIDIHFNGVAPPAALFLSDEAEVLGPIDKAVVKEGYKHSVEALIKAKDSGSVSRILSKIILNKNITVDIDVDPVTA
ncbi:replication restart helicase PriA [Candidatus Magnetomonas plexicatena]|uniref:replication restart helicase PriA n=1 Tax=Candidatus Magnetomonas plexicatena TaxID=2552947 RepID=UPI001104BA52|nr:primosomal protein N' [Nitrospirales bacterium LBB_01]